MMERESVPDAYNHPFMRALVVSIQEADRAFEKDGATGSKCWTRDYFLPALWECGLDVTLLSVTRAGQRSAGAAPAAGVDVEALKAALCDCRLIERLGHDGLCIRRGAKIDAHFDAAIDAAMKADAARLAPPKAEQPGEGSR
jgi:hypothetical protein